MQSTRLSVPSAHTYISDPGAEVISINNRDSYEHVKKKVLEFTNSNMIPKSIEISDDCKSLMATTAVRFELNDEQLYAFMLIATHSCIERPKDKL